MPHKFPFSRKDKLDSDSRRKTLPAHETLQKLGLKEGDRLLDIGCGSGYFSISAAEIVGESGSVTGFDLQPEFVEYAQKRTDAGFANLDFRVCEESRLPQADASSDAVLIALVLHETESQQDFLSEVKRVLVPSGRLLIVEWLANATGNGPPLEDRIKAEELQTILAANGFTGGESISLGKTHYGMIATVR